MGVEATHDEVIQVVLERVSNVLGRPLVEGQNNQTISLAVQNLRKPIATCPATAAYSSPLISKENQRPVIIKSGFLHKRSK